MRHGIEISRRRAAVQRALKRQQLTTRQLRELAGVPAESIYTLLKAMERDGVIRRCGKVPNEPGGTIWLWELTQKSPAAATVGR